MSNEEQIKRDGLGASGFPFTARVCFRRDVAQAAKARGLGRLAFGTFHGRSDENDVPSVTDMRRRASASANGPSWFVANVT